MKKGELTKAALRKLEACTDGRCATIGTDDESIRALHAGYIGHRTGKIKTAPCARSTAGHREYIRRQRAAKKGTQ